MTGQLGYLSLFRFRCLPRNPFGPGRVAQKIDVCTQLQQIVASCTELHYSCTVQALCNRAGAVVASAAVAAAF